MTGHSVTEAGSVTRLVWAADSEPLATGTITDVSPNRASRHASRFLSCWSFSLYHLLFTRLPAARWLHRKLPRPTCTSTRARHDAHRPLLLYSSLALSLRLDPRMVHLSPFCSFAGPPRRRLPFQRRRAVFCARTGSIRHVLVDGNVTGDASGTRLIIAPPADLLTAGLAGDGLQHAGSQRADIP